MAQIEIDEILNSIKSENEMKNDMFSKTLEEINSKLEDISNDGATTDAIKSSLQDLEVNLEARYRANLEKFENIKSSIETLNENQELLSKNSDLKIMFNVLNENIDNFAHEINEQKELINDIEVKISEFRNDNSKKDEIIEKVSIVKEGIDEVNRGLQASIMEVNSSLRGITKTLMTMDVTDQNDIIKRELENIYLSTTAILSSLEIADQKNDDIVKNMLVKDDLINLAGKIDNTFAIVSEKIDGADKSKEIISEIQKNRDELLNFNENVSKGLSDYLNSVRDVLSNCIEEIRQTQVNTSLESDSIARQKFENLEKLSDDIKKIDTTISNQSESYVSLINNKIKELAVSIDDFKTYIDKSNSGIGDKLDSKIGALDEFVVKFKEVFESKFGEFQEKVDGSIQFIETFASDGNIKLGNTLSEIVDIKGEISRILDNMTAFNSHQEANISRLDGKLDGDLVDLKNDLNNFCGSFEALKYTIEQSNLDNRELLTEIVDNASDKTRGLLDELKNNSANDSKNIFEQIEFLKGLINDLNSTFTSVSAKNVENILLNLQNAVSSINSFDEKFSEKLDSNFSSMKEAVLNSDNEIKQQISELNNNLLSSSSQNLENILSDIKKSQDKIDSLNENIPSIIDNNFNSVKETLKLSIDDTARQISDLSSNFSNVSSQNLENILTNIQSTQEKISALNSDLSASVDRSIQNLQEKISLSGADQGSKFVELEDKFSSIAKNNAENIISGIETVSDRIERLSTDISTELVNNTQSMRDVLSEAGNNSQLKLDEINERFITVAQQNAGNILSGIEAASSKIDMLGVDLSTELDNNFDMVRDFIEYSKNERNQNFVEFETLSDNIKTLESEFSKNTQLFKAVLDEQMDSLKEYFSALNNIDDKNANKEDIEKLAEKMLSIETALHEAGDNFSDNLMMLQNKITDYLKSVEDATTSTSEKLETSLSEVASIKLELQGIVKTLTDNEVETAERVNETANLLISKFDDVAINIAEIKENADTQAAQAIQKNIETIDSKFTSLQELLNDNNLRNFDGINDLSENISGKIENLKQEISLVSTDVSDAISIKTESILNEFVPLKESIDNFLNTDFDKIIDGIKSQIELSYLNFSADVNDNLTENHDNYVQLEEAYKILVDKFAKVEEIVDDLTKNQIGIMTSTISEIEKNFANNLENTNSLLESWKTEIKAIEDKISQSAENSQSNIINQITAFIKTASSANKKEIKEFIANLFENNSNAEFLEQLNQLKEFLTLENQVSQSDLNNIKENVTALHEKVDILAMSDSAETVEDLMQTIQDKIDNLSDNTANEKIEEMLQALHDKVDVLVLSDNDVKLDYIKDVLETLNEKIDDVSNSDKSELNFESDKIATLIQSLHDKIDLLVTSDSDEKLDDLVQLINDKFDNISNTDNDGKIENLVQSLHDKVDVLVTSDNDEKIDDLVQLINDKFDNISTADNEEKIENMVQALHEKVDVLALSDESEIITEIQDIKDLIFEQRKQIESFGKTERSLTVDNSLKELLSDLSNIEERLTGLDLEKNASDIKDSVMNAILTVADQITFAEETEEIKGFVEQRTDEINKNLLDVKKQLINITNGTDEWDYSYTMQDIESDIAKLRLILNDISAATSKDDINEISKNMHKIASSINSLHSSLTEEQILELKGNIEKINEDVLSLSSRTNKLLLTSDESYKALTDGLDEFSRVTNQLQKRIDELDNSGISEVIEKKLDSINEAVISSANSDNVMRQVMMYLGEWIDDASEKLETIAADASNVSIINSEICLLKSMVDNTAIVDSLERKFNEQQNRIEMLENKLDQVLNVLENQNNNQNNLNLEKKLDKLNDKISKLSQGIEKLASYVDEE